MEKNFPHSMESMESNFHFYGKQDCGKTNSSKLWKNKFHKIMESKFIVELGYPRVDEFNLSRGHHEGHGVVHQVVDFVINGLLVLKFQRDSIHIKSDKFI